MIKFQNKKIKVQGFLSELFGREITGLDLFLILYGSITLTIAAQMVCVEIELSLSKKILLAFLTLDIGGGVVANFTEGTNNYYAESLKRRYLFIAIHILQPLALSWIFADNRFVILTLAVYTLVCSFIVTGIKRKSIQKTVAATMLLIVTILTFLLDPLPQALLLILLVYSIKLILSFSVNWTD